MTIALDFTNLQILNANFKLSIFTLGGFNFVTILVFFASYIELSIFCSEKVFPKKLISNNFSDLKFFESIRILFFFFLRIFKAFFAYPLAAIISKKYLFNSVAKFLVIFELIDRTPPKALTGSELRACLKEII